MGTVARHSGAPYVRGEILDGTNDLEVDIGNIVTEVNGNLDNSNLDASANIAGTKLADNTIPTAKYQDDSVTVAKIADAAMSSYGLTTATGATSLVGGADAIFHDVEGLTTLTITPGSVNDLLVFDFTGVIKQDASDAVQINWTVSINGVDEPSFAFSSADVGAVSTSNIAVAWSYFKAAGTTSPLSIKARYKRGGGSFSTVWGSQVDVNRMFCVRSIPIKT